MSLITVSNKTQELYKKAKGLIPGGSQLFSKRAERFAPDQWPAYYEKAAGCHLWDLDGNEYIDMGLMGIGSCILGYADPDVNTAVKAAVDKGSMSSLNCPEEVELAQVLCEIHPWAEMSRFARTGGEAMAMAVRIARARRGKELILFCGYHGWHDWYLAANLSNDRALDGHLLPGLDSKGVVRSLTGTVIPFPYNDTAAFLSSIGKSQDKIAAVVMEPIRNHQPQKGFLETIREVTKKLGIVLIFDEITSGWRLNVGGAHLNFSVDPDVAVFAKGMSNGYPMAAVIGTRDVMTSAQETFISSTYWTERIGPVAALATIKKLKEENVPERLKAVGKKVQEGWKNLAAKHALPIKISGTYPLGHFVFDHTQDLVLKTLFIQCMLKEGFLAPTAFYASYAHKDQHVAEYLDAVDATFQLIAQALVEGHPEKYLKGPVCQGDFKRLT